MIHKSPLMRFSTKTFNNVIEFNCGDTLAQFWFFGPTVRVKYPATLDLRSSKVLSLRVIDKYNRFTKGSKWLSYDLPPKLFNQFAGWQPSDGTIEMMSYGKWLKMQEITNQNIQYTIKQNKTNVQLARFIMESADFKALRRFTLNSAHQLLGVDDFFNFQREKLIRRVIGRQIPEEQEEDHDHFIL